MPSFEPKSKTSTHVKRRKKFDEQLNTFLKHLASNHRVSIGVSLVITFTDDDNQNGHVMSLVVEKLPETLLLEFSDPNGDVVYNEGESYPTYGSFFEKTDNQQVILNSFNSGLPIDQQYKQLRVKVNKSSKQVYTNWTCAWWAGFIIIQRLSGASSEEVTDTESEMLPVMKQLRRALYASIFSTDGGKFEFNSNSPLQDMKFKLTAYLGMCPNEIRQFVRRRLLTPKLKLEYAQKEFVARNEGIHGVVINTICKKTIQLLMHVLSIYPELDIQIISFDQFTFTIRFRVMYDDASYIIFPPELTLTKIKSHLRDLRYNRIFSVQPAGTTVQPAGTTVQPAGTTVQPVGTTVTAPSLSYIYIKVSKYHATTNDNFSKKIHPNPTYASQPYQCSV